MLIPPRSEDYNRELENEVSILRNSNSWLNMSFAGSPYWRWHGM